MSEAELLLQKEIVIARKYHEGDQNVQLTERLAQFLGPTFGSFAFRLNVARVIVTAVVEKLSVIAFDSKDMKAIEFANKVWAENRMDALQSDVYEAMLRDSEHFVLVDWPPEEEGEEAAECARWLPQQRYTDLAAHEDADNEGCWIAYPNNDVNQKPKYGVKQWTEWVDTTTSRQRRTIYYDDRIEKFARSGTGASWEHFTDEGDAEWPLPWVDLEGLPLGIPLIHFKNKGLRLEASDGIPLQDAINKSCLDLLTTADQTAYRIYVALGFIPTTDGQDLKADESNKLEIAPGIVVGSTKSKTDADFKAIDPGDLTPLMNLVQQSIMWLALVTDTPVSRFITTKLVASDETLKEQEMPLNAKVENRQQIAGRAWIECLQMSWKLAKKYQPAEVTVPDEKPAYTIFWKDVRGMAERLSELLQKQKLRIPDSQLWSELGYSTDKVTAWKAEQEAKEAKLAADMNLTPLKNKNVNPNLKPGKSASETAAKTAAAGADANSKKETSNA